MKEVTKKFMSDSGHGWLSVKKKELIDLGIANKISSYSYMKGQSVYLEEDCDVVVYFAAQRKVSVGVKVVNGKHYDRSPIRSYKPYINS